MKVSRELGAGLRFEVEADNQINLFEALSNVDKSFQEVFGEKSCGQCDGDNIFFNTRVVEKQDNKKTKKYTYHEMKCRDCWSTLAFGEHQEGNTLFPKRKLENGEFDKKNRGWKKWVKQQASPPQEQKPTNSNSNDSVGF